jgi:DNA-binding beta-propeller fold protein YncE
MMRWGRWLYLILVVSVAATGCKSNVSETITITPTTATILLNGTQQFLASVTNSSVAVVWSVDGTVGGNVTVGTVDDTGFYTAPASLPGGTTTSITVTATQGSNFASAAVTLDSGVRVSIAPSTPAVGTGENLLFVPVVTGIPAGGSTSVTWTVTTTIGSTIGASTGIYTAGTKAGSDTVTATSVYDPSESATATVTVVIATDPTLTSIGPLNIPTTGAVGALFQDIDLAGTGFLSTTDVFVNGAQPPNLTTSLTSGNSLLVRVPNSSLTAPGTLTITVSRQGGQPVSCAVPAQCQLVISSVRPAIVGTTPDSIPVPTAGGPQVFNVDGGFFGTTFNPSVSAQFGGAPKTPTVSDSQQMTVAIDSTDVAAPGLYPVAVVDQSPGTQEAVANLAVQPPLAGATPSTVAVGTSPVAIAINSGTGQAVVANQGSNDITILNPATSTVLTASLCTGSLGALSKPCAVASAPVSVAVDNTRNIALVANSGTQNIAVVDLSGPSVKALIPSAPAGSPTDTPAAIGINPVSGRAIVAYKTAGFGSILDLTQSPPALVGIVTISNGANPRVTVSSNLNLAVVTPGGQGSLSIVDLGLTGQTSGIGITLATRASCTGTGSVMCTVTATTATTDGLQVGEAVLVTGMADSSFDGVFTVLTTPSTSTFTYTQTATGIVNASSMSGDIQAALPVATLAVNQTVSGAAFNNQTNKVILLDANVAAATILNAIDQSSTAITLPAIIGNIAVATNPLANIGVVVNESSNQAFIVDPQGATPAGTITTGNHPVDVAIDPGTNIAVIVNQNDNDVSISALTALRSPQILQVSGPSKTALADVIVGSNLTAAAAYSDDTFTIIGKGFAGSPVVRLDGDNTSVQVLSNSDRMMTVKVLASRLQAGGPRRYALDVVNGGVVSNAAGFTVAQSIDMTGTGCSAPAPLGVAIDPQNNVALVTDPGCSNVALISLTPGAAFGTGQTLAVGKNPAGVAVLPSANLAVVTNSADNTASIVDYIADTVDATLATDTAPTGVAIDPLLGEAVVAAATANVVDVFAVNSAPGTPTSIAVGSRPVAVAVDPFRHLAAVGDTSGNQVSIVNISASTASASTTAVTFPGGIAYDPPSDTFLVESTLSNQVFLVDPQGIQATTEVQVGINPTSIANNFASGTMVTTNNLSHTMTVVDFVDRRVRAVLPITPSNGFSIDIHPFTNLAVIADSANNRVLLYPLPQ